MKRKESMEFLVKQVINLLPRDVRVRRKDGEWHLFPANEKIKGDFQAGRQSLYVQTDTPLGSFEPDDVGSAITICGSKFEPGATLPPPSANTLYIVDPSIALAFLERFDLCWPESGIMIGNEHGCRYLAMPRRIEFSAKVQIQDAPFGDETAIQ